MADTAVWETLADAPAFGTLAEGKAHLLTRDLGTNRVPRIFFPDTYA